MKRLLILLIVFVLLLDASALSKSKGDPYPEDEKLIAVQIRTHRLSKLLSSPNLDAKIIVQIQKDTDLVSIAKVRSYYKVVYKNKTGYIHHGSVYYDADIYSDVNIKKNYSKLATYKTSLANSNNARLHNVELASYRNNYIIKSGQVFDFLDNANLNNGYKETDFLKERLDDFGILGAGASQVSSNIFSAVQKVSNIQVIERHAFNDPKKIPYGNAGTHAFVSVGRADVSQTRKDAKRYNFAFKNNNSFDIYISTTVDYVKLELTTDIYKINQ